MSGTVYSSYIVFFSGYAQMCKKDDGTPKKVPVNVARHARATMERFRVACVSQTQKQTLQSVQAGETKNT